jgi:hypothetical protein
VHDEQGRRRSFGARQETGWQRSSRELWGQAGCRVSGRGEDKPMTRSHHGEDKHGQHQRHRMREASRRGKKKMNRYVN